MGKSLRMRSGKQLKFYRQVKCIRSVKVCVLLAMGKGCVTTNTCQ